MLVAQTVGGCEKHRVGWNGGQVPLRRPHLWSLKYKVVNPVPQFSLFEEGHFSLDDSDERYPKLANSTRTASRRDVTDSNRAWPSAPITIRH